MVLTELVNFKEKDLMTLGKVCGYPHTALLKEEDFLYGWKIDDKRLPLQRERLDYILLSPSLMERCVQADVYPVEGVSDHYPVGILLK